MADEHVYATNQAKNVYIKNKDLQAVCDREKRLLDWEWQTSHLEMKKETAMFKKKAEHLYQRIQDIDINPNNKRVNLALELKLKTLGQSRVMQQQQQQTQQQISNQPNCSPLPVRAQTSLAENLDASPRDIDALRSRSAADVASMSAPNLSEIKTTNLSDLTVPLEHPLLKKRKKDLFARPPPRKWLEARWKAILKRHDKEKIKLDMMVEEFIEELEEYKERFRRLCNPHLYPKEEPKQTRLNRKLSLRMPVVLGGGIVNVHKEEVEEIDEESPTPRRKMMANGSVSKSNRSNGDPGVKYKVPNGDPGVKYKVPNGDPERVPNEGVVVKNRIHNNGVSPRVGDSNFNQNPEGSRSEHAEMISVTPLQSGIPTILVTDSGGSPNAQQKLPNVDVDPDCLVVRQKTPRKLLKPGLKPSNPESPRSRKESLITFFPKVSAKRASLAATPTEEKFVSLLVSESSSSDDDDGNQRRTKQNKINKPILTQQSQARHKPQITHFNHNKSDLTLQTEKLETAWEEFTKDQSLENMRKLGALAAKMKFKVTKARDKSYVPFIGATKAARAFKSLLNHNSSNNNDSDNG